MAGFELFVVFYVPMCVVIGCVPNRQPPHRLLQPLCSPIAARGVRSVAAAAISASAWPFVVPMLLSFDIFLEDDEGNPTEFPIFDAVLLSIAIGASSNPPPLCAAPVGPPHAARAAPRSVQRDRALLPLQPEGQGGLAPRHRALPPRPPPGTSSHRLSADR